MKVGLLLTISFLQSSADAATDVRNVWQDLLPDGEISCDHSTAHTSWLSILVRVQDIDHFQQLMDFLRDQVSPNLLE